MAKASEKKEKKATNKKAVNDAHANFTECPQNITIAFPDGQQLIASKKEFKTGSLGYNVSGKVLIADQKFQVACNLILIGSKPEKD